MWAYDLNLWPWRSPRLLVIRVLVLCQSTKCNFRCMAHTGQTYHVTLWPWPLILGVMAVARMRVYVLHPRINFEVILCVCVSRPMTLTFDLLTLKLVHNVARVPSCQFWWYYVYLFSIYGPLSQHGSGWSRDLATLTFDLGCRGVCGWCESSSFIHIPSLKFVGLAIRKIWRTMCVSINRPRDPDLWPFDLETGVRVASKVVNLPSKFGHARPFVLELFPMFTTDGQTDRKWCYCIFCTNYNTLDVYSPCYQLQSTFLGRKQHPSQNVQTSFLWTVWRV